jgi:hypothetical protein
MRGQEELWKPHTWYSCAWMGVRYSAAGASLCTAVRSGRMARRHWFRATMYPLKRLHRLTTA